MDKVTDKKLLVTGVFGFNGFEMLKSLLEAKGTVEPTLFSSREKSSVLEDVAEFKVKTNLGNSALRSLLMKMSGITNVSFRETTHA